MTHDFIFLIGFVTLGLLILLGSWYLNRQTYSTFLLVIIGLAIGIMIWFHTVAIKVEGNNQVHSTVLAIAQLVVLALGFKLWFALNYSRFDRLIRVLVHSLTHTSLVIVVFAGYWLKSTFPEITFFLYPLAGLSVALLTESIEESIERRSHKSTS